MIDNGELSQQQKCFVQHVCAGLSAPHAARKAGYAPSYCRKASKLLKIPRLVLAIAAIRENGRHLAAYTVAVAMQEANEAARFAREHKSPMAVVKATELRAKLSGLLIDRVEIATVDLTAALARADARVTSPPTIPAHQSTYYDAPQRSDWRPRIPGQQVAKPAADGESDSQVKKVD